ncbi:MAG: hypothetical protein HYW89_01780 [Candidatus Sungiibacteriota bacterium]|uniref:Uncharacterized protein n=1 Tax=Candidatus Sungiibacteriota bacterium TaxID=2750080 RepID=A0A7T5RL01_9BACT|nr:MAG: hypothetical protein HYW89_01780 [Candidatus Sungbacteria bacterium]
MFGLGVAFLYSLVMVLKSTPPLKVLKSAANFLYHWYLIVAALLTFIVSLVVLSGSAGVGTLLAGPLGGVAGLLIGSWFALFGLLVIALAYVFQILGSRLLYLSVETGPDGIYEVNSSKMFFGILSLFFGLVLLPVLS